MTMTMDMTTKAVETKEIKEKKQPTAVYRLEADKPLGAYFWTIVKNKLVDVIRKKYVDKREQTTDPIDLVIIGGQTKGFSFNPVSDLMEMLEKEDPDLETLVRLHHYVGMSYREIAESNMTRFKTEGSCKKATKQARDRMIEMAKNQGVYTVNDNKNKGK